MLKILLASLQLINIIRAGPNGPSFIASKLKELKETTGFFRLFSDEKFTKDSINKRCFDVPLDIQDNVPPGNRVFHKLVISAYFYDLTTDEYFFKNKENALNAILDQVESSYGETPCLTSVTNQEAFEEYKSTTYKNRCNLTRKEINKTVRDVLGQSCSVPDGFETNLRNFDQTCSEKLKKVFEMIKAQSKEYSSDFTGMYAHAKKAVNMLFLSIARSIIDGKNYQELKLRFLLITEYLFKIATGKGQTQSNKLSKIATGIGQTKFDGLSEAQEDMKKYNAKILETDLSGMTRETINAYKDSLLEIQGYVRAHIKHIKERENMINTLIRELYESEGKQVI